LQPESESTRQTRITFIVPAYNEAPTIRSVLEDVASVPFDKQVIIVDDGSTDDTAAIVESSIGELDFALTLIRQPNRGKGAAIRTAIPSIDGDIVVIQDADGEYDPADVPRLVDPIIRGVADVVFGSRLSGGQPQSDRGASPRQRT
jgi:glycosyltransferase involved in cell wall biosynthesis